MANKKSQENEQHNTCEFVCEYCGFIAKNNAAKSAHLRGCQIKKNNSSSNQISISTNNL